MRAGSLARNVAEKNIRKAVRPSERRKNISGVLKIFFRFYQN